MEYTNIQLLDYITNGVANIDRRLKKSDFLLLMSFISDLW